MAPDYITVTPPPPTAAFSGTPTSGPAPLTVQFSDASTGDPTGWAWYFGDETMDDAWTEMTADAAWTARSRHSSVALPDGSIVVMGGTDAQGIVKMNDVWRPTDQGATWAQMTADAAWPGRYGHTSVALPDNSIVVMGGYDASYARLNDVWRSTDQGATWTEMTAEAAWSGRTEHASVALPDGSIVVMGGIDDSSQWLHDVWRSTDQGATWTQMTANAAWSARYGHTSVALADGSILLMGGADGDHAGDVWRSTDQGATWTQMTAEAEWPARVFHNSNALPDGSVVIIGGQSAVVVECKDVWRSTDQGATWTQLSANAEWPGRMFHTSVTLPDGSIVVMGGVDTSWTEYSDVWRLETAGSYEQHPSHDYAELGTYGVTLQAYNLGGSSQAHQDAYITVGCWAFLPLLMR